MKEFINRFKKIERTKKLVILFITISFVFILGITTYNALTNNFENNNETADIEIIEKNTEKNNDKSDEKTANEEVEEQIEEDDTSNKLENEVETVNRQNETNNTKENNESKTDEKSVSSNTEQSSNTVTSSDNNQNSDSHSNQEDSNNNNTTITAKETISVHIQVIGMGETMMSGDLTVEKGANAYSVLQEIATKNGKTVSGSTSYVTGIGGLNEKEHGAGSGWMYKVNGYTPPKPAIAYTLNNGDSVVWYYVNYE